MRILMLAPQPFFQPRGTPFSVLHRLKALSNLGYEVDLLTYHLGQDVDIEGVNIYRIPRVPFVKKIAVGPSKTKIILDVILLIKAIKMLSTGGYGLIHSHEEAGFLATYLAKMFHMVHLYDMHSSLPQQLSNFKFTQSTFLTKWFEKLESCTIRNAEAVITICPELYGYVKQRFPDKFNMLIENVADHRVVFGEQAASFDLKDKIKSNGEVIVLYTGTFEPYQGIDLLIEASPKVIDKINQVKFVLVGGKPEQVAEYKYKVKSLKVDQNFYFTGSISPQQIPQYIAESDVLVSPRVDGNNTPLKIYSYLRSGKPIVATNHITHTQVLDANVAILTECNSEDFAHGVIKVLTDKALSKRLVQNAQKLAQERYSYESYLAKTREVYHYLEQQLEMRRRVS